MLGLAEAIEAEPDLERARFYAREIVGYAERIRDIVRQLCDDAGGEPSYRDEGGPSACARGGGHGAAVFGPRGGWLLLDLPEEANSVWGREAELEQVFVNLQNAVQAVIQRHGSLASCQMTPVSVRLERREAQIRVRVEDQGHGVPEEHRMSIFDPFYTTKGPGEGTGLGLNITYRILSRYRATIHVEESADGGASFVLTFPAMDDHSAPTGTMR